jgi:hypothetical protein
MTFLPFKPSRAKFFTSKPRSIHPENSSLFQASAQDFGAQQPRARQPHVQHPFSQLLRRVVEFGVLSAVLGSSLLGRCQATAQPTQLPTPLAASADTAVPALVPFTGIAPNSKAGPISMTFLIFKEEQGGDPLWAESQSVATDDQHHYTAMLGATLSKGLPPDLFSSGEARWLEVQISGEAPQRRVLMMSVPYALKAADATTLGGLPVSAFALAGTSGLPLAPSQIAAQAITPNAATAVTTTGGISGYLPKFTGATTVADSTIFQSGSFLGLNLTTPLATLDVNGETIQRGTLLMYPTGAATATTGMNSQPITFETSGYNSSTKADVTSFFTLKSETASNNTTAPAGQLHFLYGNTSTPSETGLYINHDGTIHFAAAQTFGSTSAAAIALTGTSTSGEGVQGTSASSIGVKGISTSNYGMDGTSQTGSGVYGYTAGTTINTAGVRGQAGTASTSGFTGIAGVWGDAANHAGVFGSSTNDSGVYGVSANSYGVYGQSSISVGVDAFSAGSYGIYSQTNSSTAGIAAIYGYSAGSTVGVKGASASGNGGEFYGGANTVGGNGVLTVGGAATSNGYGGSGGQLTGGNGGINGGNGLRAFGGSGSDSGGNGVVGTGGISGNLAGSGGVFYGASSSTGVGGDGIYAVAGAGTNANDNGLAGYFYGNVAIDGTLTADTKYFQIDHPTDPANKYLNHASIESSEMIDIYSGNVTTDENGLATITLPSWFESVNGDFRYQLTIVGRKAQAWVAKEIANGTFQIASDATNTKVSWQVTGVRHDAYAKAHPLIVEEAKNAHERGLYKHPELYNQPATKGLALARHRTSQPIATPVTTRK